ncbi:MAG: PrsW family intramembrane metalloprotease [Treponema sp.]|nr:PrsW family intramembrane metalloprotease [Treponema sp.]
MNVYLAIMLCFIPLFAFILLIRFFFNIHFITELTAVLLGLAAVLPISFLQFYISGFAPFASNIWHTQFLRALFFNGFIEELIKMVVLILLPSKKLSLGKFLLCSLLCGISLGCFESAIYFLQRLQHAHALGAQLVYRQIFMRMFTTDIVHALCAGLSCFFVWGSKNKKVHVLPFIFAVLLHGLYNFFALYDALRVFSFVAILFMAIQCRLYYMKFAKKK